MKFAVFAALKGKLWYKKNIFLIMFSFSWLDFFPLIYLSTPISTICEDDDSLC
jgi:hypothetical protein